MDTGQWVVGPEGTRWFFDSGSLALDFGYTGDYGYGVPQREPLHGVADLGSWLTERFGALEAPPNDSDFDEAIQLRASIWHVACSLADDQSPSSTEIDIINATASTPPLVPHLAGGTTQQPRPTGTAALSTVARDAITTFSSGASRIRRCGAENCALIFYDSSRPNSRRWCSMKRCGNRTKVRAHRAQAGTN